MVAFIHHFNQSRQIINRIMYANDRLQNWKTSKVSLFINSYLICIIIKIMDIIGSCYSKIVKKDTRCGVRTREALRIAS